MRAYIGPYKNWIGPYQIAEKVFFWVDKYSEDKDHRWDYRAREWLQEFLAHGFAMKQERGDNLRDDRPKTWLYKFCEWVEQKKRRKIKIKTDPYDHWNAYHTMSLLILPILKDLQANKHGSGHVDDEDVPEELRSTNAAPKVNEWDTDNLWIKRADWVLAEMIWAHEQILDDDWEAQYETGEHDLKFVKCEDGMGSYIEHGPNHTYKMDKEGWKKHQDRIDNGLRLFGKYYQSLWD